MQRYVTLLWIIFDFERWLQLFGFLAERENSTHKYLFFTEFLSAVMDDVAGRKKDNVL